MTTPELPPIYAPLDPEIAPLVIALREAGFATTHSCSGHVYPSVPWVTIRSPGFAEGPIMRLLNWCDEHAIKGNVAAVFSTEGLDWQDVPFLRLEILSDLKDAVL